MENNSHTMAAGWPVKMEKSWQADSRNLSVEKVCTVHVWYTLIKINVADMTLICYQL